MEKLRFFELYNFGSALYLIYLVSKKGEKKKEKRKRRGKRGEKRGPRCTLWVPFSGVLNPHF